jgi:hypothetical protein
MFPRRQTNKKGFEKKAVTRSAFLINTTSSKISIQKANKIQRRRGRIPNLKLKSLFEIPEDLLNCLTM